MNTEDKDPDIPHHESFNEFMKMNPPARYKDQAKYYYGTSEILMMCNDIAYDECLDELRLLQLLKGNHYELVNLGDGVHKWMFANFENEEL